MLKKIDDWTDLGEIERRMVDEEMQYALPEILILQKLAETSADDRSGQNLAAAQATHLCPANGLNSGEVVRRLREQVGHCLCQLQQKLGGTDVLPPTEMLVPILLRQLQSQR